MAGWFNETEQVPFECTHASTSAPVRIHGIVVDDTELHLQPQYDGVITYDEN